MRKYVIFTLLWAVAVMSVGCAGTFGSTAPEAHKGLENGTENGIGSTSIPAVPDMDTGDEPAVMTLPNGLTILVKRDLRFPLASIKMYVRAGSSYERPDQAGISHFIEHMMFKGTANRPVGGSAGDVEAVGGSINAATSYDYTMYYCEVPGRHWATGLDVITDMVFNPALDPHELDLERKVVLAEIDRSFDSPNSMLFKTLLGSACKGTSYEWPVLGYRKVIEKVSSEDMRAYINKFYQPRNMLLAVVGDVDPQEVFKEASRILAPKLNDRSLPVREPLPLPAVDHPVVTVTKGKWNKVYLAAAFPTPGLKSAETAGLELLAQILGGDETSKLYRKYKYDKRLVDDVSVSTVGFDGCGFLYVHAVLDPENLNKFWSGLNEDLGSLNPESFTKAEIERAKLNLEDGLFLTKETLSGLASKLGYFQFFEGSLESERNYLFDLSQVNKMQLADLAGKYMDPDKLFVSVLSPDGADISGEKLARTASKYGHGDANASAVTTSGALKGQAKVIDLPGGSRLVLLPDTTLPYTGLSIYWPGGDVLLKSDQQGLGELASKVLTMGTEKRSANQIEDFLSDRASSLSASGGRTVFSVNAKFPTRFTDDMLGLISEVLTEPAWSPEEVDRGRKDQIASIKRREDQPLGLAFRHIFPFLYASAPYSYFHQGMPDTVSGFTSKQLDAYWKEQSAAPFVMAACGDFTAETLTEFARALSQKLKGGESKVDIPEAHWSADKKKMLTLADREQAHLLAVFPVPGKKSEDTAGLNVLRAVLAGQSGLLFRDMRDKQGLGYTVTAFIWQSVDTGFMAFYIGTTPDKLEQARKGFEMTIAGLQKTELPQDELERAKNILEGEYYQEHQSLLSRSREAANLMSRGFDMNYSRQMIRNARDVTPEDIRNLVNKYLVWPDRYTLEVLP